MDAPGLPHDVAAMIAEAERQGAFGEKPAAPARAANDDDEPLDAGGYDLDAMNAEFALLLMGGTAVVYREVPDAPPRERYRLMKVDSFKILLGNRFAEIEGHDGKRRMTTWALKWLSAHRRRTFDGIVFHPDLDRNAGPKGYLNLWRGFTVTPRLGGSYAIFRDHLLNNVAGGDESVFQWIFAWFAQMLQEPRRKPGTAIVLRGAMGAGKTKVGEVIGSLIAENYFLVDDPRYITGNFNVHLGTCLFLQADEAVYAGDKHAEGRLKGLVTADANMIEAKGVDPVRMANYIRLLMTSNEDHVVPAGRDERRFAVFDVDPRCAGQHEYFAEMDEELDNGGREALLHDLLTFDYSGINLRSIPKTRALLEQKIGSFDPIEAWLLDRLHAGAPTRNHQSWPAVIPAAEWLDDYTASADRTGERRKATETAFAMKVRKLLPGLRRVRRNMPRAATATFERQWGYELPPLAECRQTFEAMLQQPIEWGDDGE